MILGFLKAVNVILLDERIEAVTIGLRRRSKPKLPDALIAATAEVHGLVLITLDDELRKSAAALGIGQGAP